MLFRSACLSYPVQLFYTFQDNLEQAYQLAKEHHKELGLYIDKICKDQDLERIHHHPALKSIKKVIVNDYIKNQIVTEDGKVSDKSKLWDNEGNKLSYENEIEKDIPVDMEISYFLNGKKISADEIAGKSGRVTIRFDYKNNVYKTMKVNGKNEKIYSPFAVVSALILDNGHFRDVDVSNGKLVNDGTRTIVVGISLPGLQENLDIDKNDFEIPTYVEITADATDFELSTTLTVVTNEVFTEIDTNKLNSVEDLTNSMNDLKSAMTQLIDGSSKLYDGLSTLLEKSNELSNGINLLNDGATELKKGTFSLNSASVQLQNGAMTLYNGLNTLSANNDTLNGGAKQVFDTLLGTATTQLNEKGLSVPALTTENYAEILNGLIAQFDSDAIYQTVLNEVTNGVNAKRGEIEAGVTQVVLEKVTEQVNIAVREVVTEQVTAGARDTIAKGVIPLVSKGIYTKESYDEAVANGTIEAGLQEIIEITINEQMMSEPIQKLIEKTTEEKMNSDEVKAIINEKVNEQMASEEIKATIAENTEAQVQKIISDMMNSEEIQAKLNQASQAAKSIIDLKTSLDSYNAFYAGLLTYTKGVSDAAKGAQLLKEGTDALKDGSVKLNDGAVQLSNGIAKMKENTPALISGVTELKDGSKKLNEGLNEFNEKGVKKITDLVDGDIDGLINRIKSTINLSKDYTAFSETDYNENANFIFRTDSIKSEN